MPIKYFSNTMLNEVANLSSLCCKAYRWVSATIRANTWSLKSIKIWPMPICSSIFLPHLPQVAPECCLLQMASLHPSWLSSSGLKGIVVVHPSKTMNYLPYLYLVKIKYVHVHGWRVSTAKRFDWRMFPIHSIFGAPSESFFAWISNVPAMSISMLSSP